jgi:tripartite-type tricarboxylate transporter receptor subunit TctC
MHQDSAVLTLHNRRMDTAAQGSSTALRAIVMAVAFGGAPIPALGQQHYPDRPIRIVVPVPAGGTADALPRIVGEKLAAKWEQPVVIENRPGAANNIGAEYVARAQADGYTLLAAPPAALVINHNLYSKLAFDPAAFVPVTVLARQPNVLVTHPRIAAGNVQELIALAKMHPDKLNYASSGRGSTLHLSMEMLMARTGVRMVHVPYKGLVPALTDLLAGQVDVMFDALGNSLPHIKSGKVKALAVGSESRFPALPDVPAMSEIFPGFVSVVWFGVVAPPKTPPEIAAKLSAAITEALSLPDVAKRFQDLAAEPMGGSPAQTAAFMKEETARWRKIIVEAGIKIDD